MKSKAKKDQLNYKNLISRIVIKFPDSLNLPCQGAAENNYFFSQNDIIPWQKLQKLFSGITINKLFTTLRPEKITELVIKAGELDGRYQPPDFHTYFAVSCPHEINVDEVLQMLLTYKNVELAYIESGPLYPPSVKTKDTRCKYQGYLNHAPHGINARYAWKINGGNGEGIVKFIDIEQGWILDHEDIIVNTLPCTGFNYNKFKDHGAAVLGVIMMQGKVPGRVGITPKVNGHIISQWRHDRSLNTADAMMAAIDHLNFGDIVLLETQVPDSPASNKLWPVEIHDATFRVIRLATALGIIVIEAGGNGNHETGVGHDLDRFTGINGKYILDRSSPDFRDSGAIIVAAATSTLPHTRIAYSNYGNRVDCYGWGEHVATAGSCPGSSGLAINTYTENFSGTSSASAIIAGAAIALQSITEANYNFRLNAIQMRAILGNDLNGTHSENGRLIDKIGVMPDLKKIIPNINNKIN